MAIGYCTVAEVKARMPRFQSGVSGNIQDGDIEKWIANRGSQIYAKLLNRGIDPGADGSQLALVIIDAAQLAAALAWLNDLNCVGAIADVMRVLEAAITLQPGDVSLAAQSDKRFWKLVDEIAEGRSDALFNVQSRVRGCAGADTIPGSTSASRGENAAFSRDMKY